MYYYLYCSVTIFIYYYTQQEEQSMKNDIRGSSRVCDYVHGEK